MSPRRLGGVCAVAFACSATSLVFAEPSARAPRAAAPVALPAAATAPRLSLAKRATVRVSAVTVPPWVSERTREALRDVVEQRLSEAKLGATRVAYSVSVSLLQLRRYIGPEGNEPRTVCIVDLALHDESGVLVGSVRGRASAVSATLHDALDAAARSAASRVPEALRMLETRP